MISVESMLNTNLIKGLKKKNFFEKKINIVMNNHATTNDISVNSVMLHKQQYSFKNVNVVHNVEIK